MQRLTAILLGWAVALASSQATALHIHTYTDHDHPEHHHGPAAHEHVDHAESHAHDGLPHLDSCDPGEHAVPVALSCTAVSHPDVVAAACGSTTELARLVRLQRTSDVTDVRVHGPPPRLQAAPRAPPLMPLA